MRVIKHGSWILLLVTTPIFAQEATFSGLGDLPGGNFSSNGWGVSGDGSVVVGQSVSENGAEAFRWENGVMEGLGDLPGSGFASIAFGLSSLGDVVVGESRGQSVFGEAFRWENGVMESLGDLPGGLLSSTAWDTSADGAVVVGQASPGGVAPREGAFRWENGVMEALPDLPGGDVKSRAHGISDDGSIIVGSSGGSDGNEAVRWVDTVVEGLGSPANGHSAVAYDCSADGTVVVGEYFLDSPFRQAGFIWRDGVGMEQLPDFPGPTPLLVARAVSGDGRVVAGTVSGTEGSGAFIWTAETGTRLLKSVLVNLYGLDLTGWTLGTVYNHGINDDGTVLVGEGINPNGDHEGWRATLPPWPVAGEPELPEDLASLGVYPNPVRDYARVRVVLDTPAEGRATLSDVLGRVVAVIHKGPLAAGGHSLLFSAAELPAGVYVVRADFGKAGTASRAVTVLR